MTILLTPEALAERIMALERLVEERFKSSETAMMAAKDSMERRLDGMNEFRNALSDATNKMITRNEYDANHQKIVDDIKLLMKAKSELEGKASQQSLMMVLAVSLTAFVTGVVGLIMRFLKI